MPKIR